MHGILTSPLLVLALRRSTEKPSVGPTPVLQPSSFASLLEVFRCQGQPVTAHRAAPEVGDLGDLHLRVTSGLEMERHLHSREGVGITPATAQTPPPACHAAGPTALGVRGGHCRSSNSSSAEYVGLSFVGCVCFSALPLEGLARTRA